MPNCSVIRHGYFCDIFLMKASFEESLKGLCLSQSNQRLFFNFFYELTLNSLGVVKCIIDPYSNFKWTSFRHEWVNLFSVMVRGEVKWVSENLCILVLWMKVALALEGVGIHLKLTLVLKSKKSLINKHEGMLL